MERELPWSLDCWTIGHGLRQGDTAAWRAQPRITCCSAPCPALASAAHLARTPETHDAVGACARHDWQLGMRRDMRHALV